MHARESNPLVAKSQSVSGAHSSETRRRLVLSLAVGLLPPMATWAQSTPAPARHAMSPFEGRWRIESPAGESGGLWIFDGKLRLVDLAGYPLSEDMKYRIVGDRLEVERQPNAGVQLVLILRSDDRLVGQDVGLGQMVFARVSPRPPPPPAAPRTDATPIATAPVPPVRGRYLPEGRSDGGMQFLEGMVQFFDGGKPAGGLPFHQQGATVTIYGPHMNETLVVLQDGRLRLVRQGMVPMHFRKAGR